MQMSRNERLVYGAHLLDAASFLPGCWWQFEGSLRRSVSRTNQQYRTDAGQRPKEVQLPIETVQSWAQSAVEEGPRLLRELAQFLRKESEIGHRRNAGPCVQRDVDRRRWMRSNVLRKRLQNGGEGGGGTMRLHFPLVLRSQMQSLPNQENHPHLSIENRRTKWTKSDTNFPAPKRGKERTKPTNGGPTNWPIQVPQFFFLITFKNYPINMRHQRFDKYDSTIIIMNTIVPLNQLVSVL